MFVACSRSQEIRQTYTHIRTHRLCVKVQVKENLRRENCRLQLSYPI